MTSTTPWILTDNRQMNQKLSNQAIPNKVTIHHPLMSLTEASAKESLDVVGMTVEVRADADGAGVIVDLSLNKEPVLVSAMEVVLAAEIDKICVVPLNVKVSG